MPQLRVRKVDDDLVLQLKQRAARAGRSAEAEHRLILAEALRGRAHSDSAELIREDRDSGKPGAAS